MNEVTQILENTVGKCCPNKYREIRVAVIDSGDEDVLSHVSRGTRPSAAVPDLAHLPWFSLFFLLQIKEVR